MSALTTASSRQPGPCRFWKVSFNRESIQFLNNQPKLAAAEAERQ